MTGTRDTHSRIVAKIVGVWAFLVPGMSLAQTAVPGTLSQPPWMTDTTNQPTTTRHTRIPPPPSNSAHPLLPEPPAVTPSATTVQPVPSGDTQHPASNATPRETAPQQHPVVGREPWAEPGVSPSVRARTEDPPGSARATTPQATTDPPPKPPTQTTAAPTELPLFDFHLGGSFAAPSVGDATFEGMGSASGLFTSPGRSLGFDHPWISSMEATAAWYGETWAGIQGMFSYGFLSPDAAMSPIIMPGATGTQGARSIAFGLGPTFQKKLGSFIPRFALLVGGRTSVFPLAGFPPSYENRCSGGMCHLVPVAPPAVSWDFIIQPRASVDVMLVQGKELTLTAGVFAGVELLPGVGFIGGLSVGSMFGQRPPARP